MKSLILQNKAVAVAILVALIILIAVYYKGRSDGSEPGFFTRLFGLDDNSDNTGSKDVVRKVYVSDGTGDNAWNPQSVTDRLYQTIQDHRWYSPNGTDINNAFATFNSLSYNQKIAVINDWEQRIKGLDVSGWGTGDYGSLYDTISQWQGNFQPQVEIAWSWMNSNQIE
ncbi:hypothetical protein [Croceimicrobium hydrocarbonivorans]|uniref:Uncharacterized protein n=1 Tax=Croceimicrobium hydrocarbonivorans TaxID=2761580 RepID=A0A7H0VB65_9FLAO|nr:hypothetical protein [Croceimicrobium hydrocarbonivorans]QNR22963.1 hypothetical protein H4K34_11295 [Croceimicrobium hydrocarbonivorans]QNR23007.1 hypothetical protein H4K34_11515 [Croceimicrobium hydrocarbonivorans]